MADPRIDQARHERNVEKAKRRNAKEELEHSEALFDVIQKTNKELTEEADLYKRQRDELLEGIEAHREARRIPGDGPEFIARTKLYALADRIKNKGGDASARRSQRLCRPESESTRTTRGGSDQVDGVAPEQTSELLATVEAIWPALRDPDHPDHEPAPHAGRKLRVAAEKARAPLSSDEEER